jgi:hypothetical protein
MRVLKVHGVALATAAAAFGLVMLFTAAAREHKRWVSWCHAQGGHVTSTTDTRVGTALVNGKVTTVITTDSTHYCLAGGDILDIR